MIRRFVAAAATALLAVTAIPVAHAQQDPNYVWRNDPVSKTLAGKPLAQSVLHRVPGSLHDAPRTPQEALDAQARGNALYGPGTPIFIGTGENAVICTVAVAGYDDAGRKVAVTAGHCAEVGAPVVSADARGLGQTGRVVHVDSRLDYALIHLAPNTEVTRSYDGLTINHLGSAPIQPGGQVCKKGVASGVTCGLTWRDWDLMNINQVCAMQGDSGAPLYVGDRLVGLINGGMFPQPFAVACHSPLQGPIHAPTGSARADAIFPQFPGGFRLP
ncbi:S1 family peptidase [Corynebacterium glaucum]|uniref:S1 family peptidase n=1 Tax=Corynebacterium glaucum TaxID=187491 RepID=UPI0026587B22|nr:S1 family peptidase [Corynebacterium glaucum]